jgi:hypothetical protein
VGREVVERFYRDLFASVGDEQITVKGVALAHPYAVGLSDTALLMPRSRPRTRTAGRSRVARSTQPSSRARRPGRCAATSGTWLSSTERFARDGAGEEPTFGVQLEHGRCAAFGRPMQHHEVVPPEGEAVRGGVDVQCRARPKLCSLRAGSHRTWDLAVLPGAGGHSCSWLLAAARMGGRRAARRKRAG